MKILPVLIVLTGLILVSNPSHAQFDRQKCAQVLDEYKVCIKVAPEADCRASLYQKGKSVCVVDSSDTDAGGGYAPASSFTCQVRLPFCRLFPFISGCNYKELCKCDMTHSPKCNNLAL